MPRLLLVFVLLLTPSALIAGDKPAAKLRSPVGTVLQRKDANGWLTPMLYDALPAGSQLLSLPGARGLLDIREGNKGVAPDDPADLFAAYLESIRKMVEFVDRQG